MKTIAVLVMLLAAAAPASARTPSFERIPSGVVPSEVSLTDRDPGELCESCNNNYEWTVSGWMTGSEAYKVYCEPADCQYCEGGWKPLSITMYLYWATENTCALSMSVDIEEVDVSDPLCPAPGETLCASEPMTVGPFSPPGLWAVTLPLPGECADIDGPFFAGINVLDTCDELPEIVTDAGPCEPCVSWNNWGTGWVDICDHGFPGNLSAYTTLECQGPTAVRLETWSTIKSHYRPKSD